MQESNQLPLSDIPGGEYKTLQETAVGWCPNPVSGMTSASSVLLSKQTTKEHFHSQGAYKKKMDIRYYVK